MTHPSIKVKEKNPWPSISLILLLTACSPSPTVMAPVPSSQPSETPSAAAPASETLPPILQPITGAGDIAPYPDAPLCPDSGEAHDNNLFHTLWDGTRGCHYDHEHGQDPFTPSVVAAFPGFNLPALLGNVSIGHTNPSSPMENTHKHGGFKWQVDVAAPQGCNIGFEDGTIAVDAYAIQYHVFGQQSIEFEARNHSTAAMLRFCTEDNPADKGYIYVVQLQEYGQRVMPYQGMVLPYPDNFQPVYISPRGPYFTTECEGQDTSYLDVDGSTRIVDCRNAGDTLNNNNSTWTSKPTQSSGPRERPETPKLFRLLFHARDNYQRMDVRDLTYPFTWMFVCGGTSYNPVGCRYNNSTTKVLEVMGDIPADWDGLSGFDTDPRPGRITAQGFVTRIGDLDLACTVPGGDCYPIKLVSAFVGRYSSELSAEKVSNPTPENTPERDIYFCDGQPCAEGDPGATSSGWIGPDN